MDPVFLANALAFFGRHWKTLAIAGLIGTNALTLHACDGVHKDFTKEKAAHAADIKSYKDAQAVAERRAAEIKSNLEKENKEKANAADANYSALLSKYRANLVRFQAAQSVPSRPSGGQQDGTTPSYNGPSYSSNIPDGSITITNKDADICAVNTARLQAAHDWAETLKDGK